MHIVLHIYIMYIYKYIRTHTHTYIYIHILHALCLEINGVTLIEATLSHWDYHKVFCWCLPYQHSFSKFLPFQAVQFQHQSISKFLPLFSTYTLFAWTMSNRNIFRRRSPSCSELLVCRLLMLGSLQSISLFQEADICRKNQVSLGWCRGKKT